MALRKVLSYINTSATVIVGIIIIIIIIAHLYSALS